MNYIRQIILFSLIFVNTAFGQKLKNVSIQECDTTQGYQCIQYKNRALLIPVALVGYGVAGFKSTKIQNLNLQIRKKITDNIDKKTSVDDFTKYAPFVSVYALNAAGIKGKNNFKDRTIILGTAFIIMGSTVSILKNATHVLRPDGTTYNSFPSGHTATVFLGAEFLYQEYKDVSVWYGLSGYFVATGTGLFRLYNNRHWLTDVAAGAGIGILSTKIAHWAHPFIQKTLFKNNKSVSGIILPVYNKTEYGLRLSMSF